MAVSHIHRVVFVGVVFVLLKHLPIFFPDTCLKMAMVSEFLKQAWYIDNQEQEYIVSSQNIMT